MPDPLKSAEEKKYNCIYCNLKNGAYIVHNCEFEMKLQARDARIKEQAEEIKRLKSTQATDHVVEELESLRSKVERLREAGKAYQELCVCYRVGRHPTESLHKRLYLAKQALEESK